MARFLYRLYGGFFRYQAWSRRRFTLAGYVVFSGAVIAAALGIDTRYTLAYQLFAFLSALIAVAYAFALKRPSGVSARLEAPSSAQAGAAVRLRVLARNDGRRTQAGLQVRLETQDPRPEAAAFRAARDPVRRNRFDRALGFYRYASLLHARRNTDLALADLPELAPGASVHVQLNIVPYRRGRVRISGLSVLRADPLGLVRASRFVPSPAVILVLPRRYVVRRKPLSGQRSHQPGGVTFAGSVGDSEEFFALRDYRPGDPWPRIHWKSFARTGKPIVKEYQDEYFERQALVLDTFVPPGGERAFEEAVSIAASHVSTLHGGENLLDLLFVESRPYAYTAGRGALPVEHLLELLACIEPAQGTRFEDLAAMVKSERAALSAALIVLLDWDAPRRNFVEALRASGLPLAVLLVSEREPAERPGWLQVLQPGKVQEGLDAR